MTEHPNMDRCQPWGTEDECYDAWDKPCMSQSYTDSLLASPTAGFVPTHLLFEVVEGKTLLECHLIDDWSFNLFGPGEELAEVQPSDIGVRSDNFSYSSKQYSH